ncbi:MAG: hypothetical protein QOI06_2086 [Nocardioidaceae bacterium]|nr:hypothetical protein [Nocardioidaceae bacterium]
MTVRATRLALVAAAGALGFLAASGAAIAHPRTDVVVAGQGRGGVNPLGAGTPGYCPTQTGVTVVVDFNELGGGIVVRCAPGPVGSGFTGLDALTGAGFSPTGTQRWGLAFICRIAGKPTANQRLHIKGDRNYQEACVDTPPPEAFWSYWYAPNGGRWMYSTGGPTNRDAIPGGFEGWSFSLNHSPSSAPPPGVAPERPHQPPPTTPPPTTRRTPTHAPGTHRPSHGAGGPPKHTSSPAGPTPTTPPGSAPVTTPSTQTPTHERASPTGRDARRTGRKPTATGPAPGPVDNPVAVGHNAAGVKVSGSLPQDGSSPHDSAVTAVIGIGVVAMLAVGGFAAWRRRADR